jgi:hypothetical protein
LFSKVNRHRDNWAGDLQPRNQVPSKWLSERLAVAAGGGATVISANDYLEMARECMALSAEACTAERQKALVSMAKLYTQTALRMQGPVKPVPSPADDAAGECDTR